MYRRVNKLEENARRSMLRSNLRKSLYEAEDETDESEDIEIEADATEAPETEADPDFKQKLIDLFNQAITAGIITIEDLTGEAADGEEAEGDEDLGDEDFDFDLEESAKAKRAKKVQEASARIRARNSRTARVANPRMARRVH